VILYYERNTVLLKKNTKNVSFAKYCLMSNFLHLYTYINIKYPYKLAFAKDPIGTERVWVRGMVFNVIYNLISAYEILSAYFQWGPLQMLAYMGI
jgi:hypothetical protein